MQKIFRTLLIIAILITSYLLILAWQKDYGNMPATPVVTATSSGSDITPNSGDVPVTTTTTNITSTTSDKLISVKTDVYDIKINPVGGDIVYLALNNYKAKQGSNEPFVMLENDANRTYVAQSLIAGRDGIDTANGRAIYVSNKDSYTLADGVLSVPLVYQKDGLTVKKTYTFEQGKYPIKLSQTIVNSTDKDWQGDVFVQLKRDNSKDPGLADKGAMGIATYLGGAWGTPSEPYHKIKFKDFNSDSPNVVSDKGWVAIVQHYFVSAWAPNTVNGKLFSRTSNNDNYIGYSTAVSIGAGKQINIDNTLYVGPKIHKELSSVATGLERTVDYGVFWPISKPMFWILDNLHGIFGNWGWAIIGLTLIVKIALMWISGKSYYSMAKMRAIAPKLEALKEKHGDDRMAMSQAMMQLYRDEKVNPMAGCLPIFLQMPIFLGLYWCLVESVELRHAPWILWIKDLSSMDPWFILPILMGATMFIQQQLNPQPTDPMQAKVMKILPIVFTVFMLFFPAGLVLYWTVNNLFSMAQQQYINKKVEKEYQAKTTA